jgi:asparagine synthase (glutamine-hydrolysing)
MCGFAGLIDQGRVAAGLAPEDREALARMTRALAARGPDGEGMVFSPGVGLGHRRLKVLDLSAAGAQPMTNAAGTIDLVHNGEIYNFAELRAELLASGHRFRSRSDSEVLLAGYEQWGDAVLGRIQGMFAFAIWDRRRRRLLAARDRMGKKPFYFAALPRNAAPPLFAFGSECKALVHAPGFERRIDGAALGRYLAHEYVPPPHTIFAGLSKLDAGECLVLDLGADPRARPQISRYWDLAFPDPHPALHPADAAEALWTLLRRGVERRLVADVPVGVFLSGGLDSSAVAAAAVDLAGGDQIATFSIGFTDPSFDESAHARTVARHLGTRHHEEFLDARRMLDLLPDVAAFLDEPFADASIIPTALLARFARQHVTVALGGDGGDELFAGYPTFKADIVADWIFDRAPAALGGLLARMARLVPARDRYFSLDFRLQQFLRAGAQPGPVRHQRWLGSFLPEELPGLLQDDWARAAVAQPPLAQVAALAERPGVREPADRLLDFYTRFYLANDLNVKVDRAAGAVGLEVRAPLLDADVVAFASTLPGRLRQHGMTSKYLLKRALRGRLPDSIIDRPKQGFGVPVARWLKQDLRGWMQDLLAPERLRRQGIFRPAAVGALIDDHLGGRRDRRKQLWTLLAFQSWWGAWAEDRGTSGPAG